MNMQNDYLRKQKTPASSPILLHKYVSSDSSVSSKDSSPTVSGTEPIILLPASRDYPLIVTVTASTTMDQDVPEETLYSRAGPLDRRYRTTTVRVA